MGNFEPFLGQTGNDCGVTLFHRLLTRPLSPSLPLFLPSSLARRRSISNSITRCSLFCPLPLRHFIEFRKKLMLVDALFNIIELQANIFNKIQLLGDWQNSRLSPIIYHQNCSAPPLDFHLVWALSPMDYTYRNVLNYDEIIFFLLNLELSSIAYYAL